VSEAGLPDRSVRPPLDYLWLDLDCEHTTQLLTAPYRLLQQLPPRPYRQRPKSPLIQQSLKPDWLSIMHDEHRRHPCCNHALCPHGQTPQYGAPPTVQLWKTAAPCTGPRPP